MKRAAMTIWILAIGAGLCLIGTPGRAQDDAPAKPTGAAPAAPTADAKPADAEAPARADPVLPAFDIAEVSYALGVDIGRSISGNFKQSGLEVDHDRLLSGFTAGLNGKDIELTDAQIAAAMYDLQLQLFCKRVPPQMLPALAEKWEADKDFLEENAKADGVVTTDSGLQYKIIEQGEGPAPKLGDTVSVNYHGTLVDGTVFDSSVKPPQPDREPGPLDVQVGRVIPGWNEGLTHIGTGGKMMLYIPAPLAYGVQGSGGVIGPNAALVFEVEVLAINPEPQTPPAPIAPPTTQPQDAEG